MLPVPTPLPPLPSILRYTCHIRYLDVQLDRLGVSWPLLRALRAARVLRLLRLNPNMRRFEATMAASASALFNMCGIVILVLAIYALVRCSRLWCGEKPVVSGE